MQGQRTQKVKLEKVFVAVDVNNVWHLARNIFGVQTRVDFAGLLRKIKSAGFDKVPREVKATAYTITAPNRRVSPRGEVQEKKSNNKRFLDTLGKFGFDVKTRTMRWEKGIDKPFHTDWDVGITVDVFSKIQWFDTFVLVSGDGDYVPLLKRVQEAGKRVEIYTFENVVSPILFDNSDEIHYLNENDIFQERLIERNG